MIATVVESELGVHAEEARLSLTNLPLPPSERDFELYGLVVTEGASTRAAAQVFGLSQTRVIQIRNRVAEWIASEVPPLAHATPVQRLALAADIARNRFDFVYSQAMDCWRESKGPQTVERNGSSGKVSSTRESQGDPRYLMLAARIAERTLGLEAKIERATEVAQKLTKAIGQKPADHPVGDCSPLAADEEGRAQVDERPVAVSEVAPIVSDENQRKRRVFFDGPNGEFEDCSAGPRASISPMDGRRAKAASSSGSG
ncbi:MAG: hypothetical protein L0211_19180 [Planctomycetaceae bacterium]|nr:hypothetical protein [Planctomycetaceae bacterium]